MNIHPYLAIASTGLYHPEDPPAECSALVVGIVVVPWDDFSWFNGASTIVRDDVRVYERARPSGRDPKTCCVLVAILTICEPLVN